MLTALITTHTNRKVIIGHVAAIIDDTSSPHRDVPLLPAPVPVDDVDVSAVGGDKG